MLIELSLPGIFHPNLKYSRYIELIVPSATMYSKGNIYIVDYGGIVQMFDKDYNYLKDFISISGTDFIDFGGIKFIQNDTLILAESNKGMIGFFNSNGILIKEKSISETSYINHGMLRQITTDDLNNIYVADHFNNEVVKLNINGDLVKKWKPAFIPSGPDGNISGLLYYNNSLLLSAPYEGKIEFFSLDGQFIKCWEGIYAYSIAMDNESNFYFACVDRIIKTNSIGKIVSLIGVGDLKNAQSVNVCENGDVLVIDSDGENSKVNIYK